jgi:hypothetical protein
MTDTGGFTTTPSLDGARVRAKNLSDPRWGTSGTCFGMLGNEYVLVMFDEFDSYVAAVPVAEFAEHYFLLPQMSHAWCSETYKQSIPPDSSPPVRPEDRERQHQVARSLGFRNSVTEQSNSFRHSQR